MARPKTPRRGNFGMLQDMAQKLGGLLGMGDEMEGLSAAELEALSLQLMQGIIPFGSDALSDDDFDDFGDDFDDDEDDWYQEYDALPQVFLPDPLTSAELLAGGRQVPSREQTEQPDVGAALGRLTLARLREIAAHWGWKLSGQKREDLLASLTAHYADEASLARARARFTPEDRRLIGMIRAVQVMDGQSLKYILGKVDDGQSTLAGMLQRGEVLLQQALQKGLLLENGRDMVFPQGLYAGSTVAADLLPAPADLSRLRVVPAPDPLQSLSQWVEAMQELRDPLALRDPVAQGGARAPKGWQIGTPLLDLPLEAGNPKRRLIPPVGSSFQPKLLAWMQRKLGLSRTSGAELLVWVFGGLAGLIQLQNAPEEAATDLTESAEAALRRALQLETTDLVYLLMRLWMALPYGQYDEWSWTRLEDPSAAFQLEMTQNWNQSTELWQQGLARSRRDIGNRILSRLGRADPALGGWLDMAAFLRLAGLVEPQSAMGDHAGWQMTDRQGKTLTDFQQGGAHVWRYVIEGPLHSLGLVDLARDAAGATQALRLSAVGRCHFHNRAPSPSTDNDARWTGADSLSLPVSVAQLPLINSLGLAFRLAEADGGRAIFHLDQMHCRDSFRAGGDADSIQSLLAAKGLPLPPAVADSLRRWWEAWGRWVLRPGWSILSFADEATAEEVLAGVALREQLTFRLSATRWLVDPAQEAAVLAALQRAGHRPMVLDAPSADAKTEAARHDR